MDLYVGSVGGYNDGDTVNGNHKDMDGDELQNNLINKIFQYQTKEIKWNKQRGRKS